MTQTITFDGYELTLLKASYEIDNTLAVRANTSEGESYAVFTVNLELPPDILEHNEQFFDINLYKGEELLELLIKEKIVEKLGFKLRSGFVVYPLVRWNLEQENNK